MAYAYQQNFYDGASYGWVKYDISPAFGEYVAPGDQITITGQAYCNISARKYIDISFSAGTGISSAVYFGSGAYSVSIPKGKATKFTIVYTIPEPSSQIPTSRTTQMYLSFGLLDASYGGDVTVANAAQRITYLRYRVAKSIYADFERHSVSNGVYEPDTGNGTYALGSLQVEMAENHSYSEITIASATITTAAGAEIGVVTIPSNVLQVAATESGYVESTIGLFSGVSFALNTAYTLTFEIGDAYGTVIFQETIPKALANMVLSRFDTGVCFGGYPQATPEKKMLESYYPLYLYEGFGDPAGIIAGLKAALVDAIYPIGSIYITAVSTSPETLFGGTWVRIEDRFILAAGSSYPAGTTGGAATHKHTAPIGYNTGNSFLGISFVQGEETVDVTGAYAYYANAMSTGYGKANWRLGKTDAISNLPPYMAVYVWKRTA